MKEDKIESQFENEWVKAKGMFKSAFVNGHYALREDNLRLIAMGFYFFGRSIEKEEITEEVLKKLK